MCDVTCGAAAEGTGLTREEIKAVKKNISRTPEYLHFEIYDAVHLEGASQRQAAVRFRLSQPRICQILKEVDAWLREHGDPLGGATPRQRRQTADRLHRERLQHLYSRTMQAWNDSCGEQRRTLYGKDAYGTPTTTTVDVRSQGKPIYMRLAAWLAEQMAKADMLHLEAKMADRMPEAASAQESDAQESEKRLSPSPDEADPGASTEPTPTPQPEPQNRVMEHSAEPEEDVEAPDDVENPLITSREASLERMQSLLNESVDAGKLKPQEFGAAYDELLKLLESFPEESPAPALAT